MAANIFNQEDYHTIVNRIKSLNTNNQRRWGTMNIQQMLEHCALQLTLGLGHLPQPPVEGSPIMRTGLGRWLLLYVVPWPKGLPTPSKMNVIESNISIADLESEKVSLLNLLEEVQQNPNLLPHPFFGTLNQKYWGRLIWKHLDHHLTQFGG